MSKRLLVLAALVVPSAACGLIDSDITNFDLALPNKQFTIDAGRWGLRNADQLVSTQCQPANPDPCAMAAQQACNMGSCSAQCDTTTNTCDLTLLVSLFNAIDLVSEKPELQQIQDQPLIDVSVDAIKYEVTNNEMNVDTPELVVYVAPSTVMTPDARAKRVGTVPPIPAGMDTELGVQNIVFDPMGKANLASFMGDYKTPFNIIVGTAMLVEQGDMIPSGRLTVRVSVEAHAGI